MASKKNPSGNKANMKLIRKMQKEIKQITYSINLALGGPMKNHFNSSKSCFLKND